MTQRGNLVPYDSPTPQIGHEIVDHVFLLFGEKGMALFLDQKIEPSLFRWFGPTPPIGAYFYISFAPQLEQYFPNSTNLVHPGHIIIVWCNGGRNISKAPVSVFDSVLGRVVVITVWVICSKSGLISP